MSFTEKMRDLKKRMNEELSILEEFNVSEDTNLLDQVEELCTAEKPFSYWASVAFGVKPRDVLRKILHEAEAQKQRWSGQ